MSLESAIRLVGPNVRTEEPRETSRGVPQQRRPGNEQIHPLYSERAHGLTFWRREDSHSRITTGNPRGAGIRRTNTKARDQFTHIQGKRGSR